MFRPTNDPFPCMSSDISTVVATGSCMHGHEMPQQIDGTSTHGKFKQKKPKSEKA